MLAKRFSQDAVHVALTKFPIYRRKQILPFCAFIANSLGGAIQLHAFAGRWSEKREYQIEQLDLRLEELQARRTKETAAMEKSPPTITSMAPVRRALPEHLPREVRKYLPKQEACGKEASQAWPLWVHRPRKIPKQRL